MKYNSPPGQSIHFATVSNISLLSFAGAGRTTIPTAPTQGRERHISQAEFYQVLVTLRPRNTYLREPPGRTR